MSSAILKLAIKSLRFRKFSIALTIFSLATSIMLFIAVDMIRVQAKDNFVNSVADIDLIVGSRSGTVQLLLYSIFHIGSATNNVSWETYKKISSHPRISWSIPISLGDSHKGFSVIGTEVNFFDHYHVNKNKPLEFIQGSRFTQPYDAVIGANVAKQLSYSIDDEIVLAHGMGNVALARHDNLPFKISGILKPTGSTVDDSIMISLIDLELLHVGWEHGIPSPETLNKIDLNNKEDIQPKSITAFLLKIKSKHDVFSIQRAINDYKKEPLLAILPGLTLLELWKVVSIIEKVLLIISAFVIITAIFSMLAIILSHLNSRRNEIAILRSIGASPIGICLLMIIETELLIIISIILAILFTFLAVTFIGPIIDERFGIAIELMLPTNFQVIVILGILLAGLFVSLIPAIRAYYNTLHDGLTIR